MRILYGIQGTGNGHLSRSREVIRALEKEAKVEVLISGGNPELDVGMKVHHRLQGLTFAFGTNGGIDLMRTLKKNRVKKFLKETAMFSLNKYDLIISDFEPVTARAAFQQNRSCIALSNQASLLFDEVPKAKKSDPVGQYIIKHYAPCSLNFGYSYRKYNDRVYTPVIRPELCSRVPFNRGHYTVYLPSYSIPKIKKVLGRLDAIRWEVFSREVDKPINLGKMTVFPLDAASFEESLLTCEGVVTAAGFGTTTEALYLGKKLLVIPQKNQYEQACNAKALRQMGVSVLKSLKSKHVELIEDWAERVQPVQMAYLDETEKLKNHLLSVHFNETDTYAEHLTRDQYLV